MKGISSSAIILQQTKTSRGWLMAGGGVVGRRRAGPTRRRSSWRRVYNSILLQIRMQSFCFLLLLLLLLLLPNSRGTNAMMVNMTSLMMCNNKKDRSNSKSTTTSAKTTTTTTTSTTVSVTNLQLPPSSRIQKVEGYIHGVDRSGTAVGGVLGGYIDISDLTFTISAAPAASATTITTAAENEGDNDSSSSGGAGDQAEDGDEDDDIPSFLDLALLYIPDRCHETPEGCDLAKDLGVGVPSSKSGKSNSWYCCTRDAHFDGACDSADGRTRTTDFGRLILNPQLFHGETRSIAIDSSLASNNALLQVRRHFVGDQADFAANNGAGEYALILANCNMLHSRLVVVNGTVSFVSSSTATAPTTGGMDDNGYDLATEQQNYQNQGATQVQDCALFYPALAIFYLLLLVWFARLFIRNVNSRIALEKWILVTTVLGFCEMTLRAMEYCIWQYNTYRRYEHHDDEMTGQVVPTDISSNTSALHPAWLALVAVLFGSCKHSIGRSLFLMLALGWGVVRAELRRCTMTLIVGMASVYMICDAAFDLVSYLVTFHDYQISMPLGNLLLIGFILKNVVEVTFIIWIPVALCRTMTFLKTTRQDQKLKRYRLLLYSLATAVTLTTLTILYLTFGPPNVGSPMVSLSIGNEVNFFLILLLVAIVWRPNPNAHDYAYVMQLSTSDGGAAEDEDDGIMLDSLDLSGKSTTTTATVPMHDHVIA
jgi:uncharacterized membrane protein YciS (DUF1049 family)/outer membrane lipoprotein SlyB